MRFKEERDVDITCGLDFIFVRQQGSLKLPRHGQFSIHDAVLFFNFFSGGLQFISERLIDKQPALKILKPFDGFFGLDELTLARKGAGETQVGTGFAAVKLDNLFKNRQP